MSSCLNLYCLSGKITQPHKSLHYHFKPLNFEANFLKIVTMWRFTILYILEFIQSHRLANFQLTSFKNFCITGFLGIFELQRFSTLLFFEVINATEQRASKIIFQLARNFTFVRILVFIKKNFSKLRVGEFPEGVACAYAKVLTNGLPKISTENFKKCIMVQVQWNEKSKTGTFSNDSLQTKVATTIEVVLFVTALYPYFHPHKNRGKKAAFGS